jgi:DNA-binding transcriptional LysR family regulator
MNRMTLDQLRVFVAVAERQHVTRAAEALNLAQSAVSAAIVALEGRHNIKLFHRVGRGIELTQAGTLFVADARAVLARVASAELVLSELGGLKRGTLSLQASQTVASYWLPRHLVVFRRAYPAIDICLNVGNTAQVVEAVRNGAVELGFVEGIVDDPVLNNIPVARDQIVIVVGTEHPWAAASNIRPTDLTKSEWVMREPGSGTRSVFERTLAAMGVPIDRLCIALELPSNEAVRAAVEAGMGSAAISASVVASSIEAGLILPVKLKLPERSFQALCHVERHRSHAADAFLEMITPRPRPATDKQKERTSGNHAGLTHSSGQLEENAQPDRSSATNGSITIL